MSGVFPDDYAPIHKTGRVKDSVGVEQYCTYGRYWTGVLKGIQTEKTALCFKKKIQIVFLQVPVRQ